MKNDQIINKMLVISITIILIAGGLLLVYVISMPDTWAEEQKQYYNAVINTCKHRCSEEGYTYYASTVPGIGAISDEDRTHHCYCENTYGLTVRIKAG